ncbi:bifunctional oligoribonuclease/PAP phosphatase NrnA [Pseudodesulfovibrio sp. JC047]|uniref:DHH family phosphoesterase n=1 Tax=Pseudodesulfovibrio sp. JC047 TaxID=2683199 RepID=UPI0013CFA101|nr:DHH family phosphoesterase [Pseudodesulfovibrio sp. JC047]NDV17850.1 bifunctional oligoribonuclease/PAP phosphatase NrnA [Pseudodesulfovibrio sp. JC047]
MENQIHKICDILRTQDDFLIASHTNPDGDAIGSICAMGYILTALGKRFSLYNASGLPERYDFISVPAPIHKSLPETLPKWTIVLDCGAKDRMGDALTARADETQFINIDHHLGNDQFGVENLVDHTQPAAGSIVALLAKELHLPLVGPLAENIYLAVATDTGFFTYGSTTPESLELTAEMLRDGLDIAHMNMTITKQWSENRMRLWTEAMNGVVVSDDQLIATTVITREMFAQTGTTSSDTENIINFLRRLKSVRIAAVLREEKTDTYKFSLRSYGDDNVQEIAAHFGGGGHKNASGGTISAPLEQARESLISTIETYLRTR